MASGYRQGDVFLKANEALPAGCVAAIHQQRAGREVHVIQVKQRIGFRGYDARPSAEDLFLTVVKGDRGWSVA